MSECFSKLLIRVEKRSLFVFYNMKTILATSFILFFMLQANAAWDTNPENPTYYWGDLREGNIVSDGLGGAFFCISSYGPLWQRVGHINADREFTFQNTAPPWEGLLLADELDFGSTINGLTLIPSEPPGTIIACDYRFDTANEYIGTEFFKFDTLGFTGFERVLVNDSNHGLVYWDRNFPNGVDCTPWAGQ